MIHLLNCHGEWSIIALTFSYLASFWFGLRMSRSSSNEGSGGVQQGLSSGKTAPTPEHEPSKRHK